MSEKRLAQRLGVFVVALAVLQSANNALPYFGLRDDSCQTMFSGLDAQARTNNHFFIGQRSVGDLWRYYRDVDADVTPPPRDRLSRELTAWLQQRDRRLNAETVRVVVRQLCDAGYHVRLRGLVRPERTQLAVADACRDPRFSSPHRLIPVRLFDTDIPEDEP